MPHHSSPSSQATPLPDFNRLVMIHQSLHDDLRLMIEARAQRRHTGVDAELSVFTPSGKRISFTLDKALPSSPLAGSTAIEVLDTAKNDSLLLSGSETDWNQISYEKQHWPRIETELKSYLTQRFGSRRAVADFNQLAAIHEDLHDSLSDMIASLAQTRLIQPSAESYEYDPAQSSLRYQLDIVVPHNAKIIVVFDKATNRPQLISTSVRQDTLNLNYDPKLWPALAQDLSTTLPGIRAGRALSRRFP